MYQIKNRLYPDFDKTQKSGVCNYLRALVKQNLGLTYSDILDKFLEDALVKCHIIDDDDYKHVRKGSWEYGGIKPGKPEIEVTISELYNKGKDYKGLDLT